MKYFCWYIRELKIWRHKNQMLWWMNVQRSNLCRKMPKSIMLHHGTRNQPFKDVDGQEIFSVKREKEQNMIMWWSKGFSIADYLSKVISRRDNIGEPRWMVQWLILTIFREYEHKIDGIQIKDVTKTHSFGRYRTCSRRPWRFTYEYIRNHFSVQIISFHFIQ